MTALGRPRTVRSSRWIRCARPVGLAIVVLTLCATPALAEPSFSGAHVLAGDVGGQYPGFAPYGAISCDAPGDCAVAGPLEGGNDTIESETGGVWGTPRQLPLPTNSDTGAFGNSQTLNGISCWSVGPCAVVGSYGVNSDLFGLPTPVSEPLVDVETDGVWFTPTEIQPVTLDPTSGETDSVSCDAAGDCTAAGYVSEVDPTTFATMDYAFTTTESAGSGVWTAPLLLTTGEPLSDDVIPQSLSCVDAMDCTLVVNVYSVRSFSTGYETEVSGAWGRVTPFSHTRKRIFDVTGLACSTATDCVAVGYSATTALHALSQTDTSPSVATETQGRWGPFGDLVLPLLSPVTDHGVLQGVGCDAGGGCEAVGYAFEAPKDQYVVPIAATWSGSSWSTVGVDQVPVRTGSAVANFTELDAVDCVTRTTCTSVGGAGRGNLDTVSMLSGFVTTVTMTQTRAVPGKPRHVTVVPALVRTTIAFEPPTTDGGARISLFTATAESSREPTRTCVTPGLSCTIPGLVAGHTYRVTVVAANSQGASGPSPTVSFTAK
jgi:hypothetical protein